MTPYTITGEHDRDIYTVRAEGPRWFVKLALWAAERVVQGEVLYRGESHLIFGINGDKPRPRP